MAKLKRIKALTGKFPIGAIVGHVGALHMIRIEDLRVDHVYQREINVNSARNIRKICEAFDWAKFLPVIVVEADGHFAIIDGQHRTTAAATLGIEAVPCYVLSCSPAEAAAAFAAINGAVTPITPIDIWFAELAAGVEAAHALQRVLDAAEVRVTRSKEALAKGETRSIGVLRRAVEKYGHDTLVTILQCITQTGDGNPGMIVGAVIHGIGCAIATKPDMLRSPSRLFDMFDRVPFAGLVHNARLESARTGNIVQAILTREINAILAQAREVAA